MTSSIQIMTYDGMSGLDINEKKSYMWESEGDILLDTICQNNRLQYGDPMICSFGGSQKSFHW